MTMTPISVRVGGDLAIGPLEPPALERLRRELSFPNPEKRKADALGIWSEHLPDRVFALEESPNGGVRVPRGAIEIVRRVLARHELEPVFKDMRSNGSRFFPAVRVDCRDYQAEAVEKLIRKVQGLVILPCATGKTRLGIAAVGMIARTSLVIVPTIDLADQWASTARKLLGAREGSEDVCILGGGEPLAFAEVALVVVAVVDTLELVLAKDPGFAWRFGLCIVDEAHHAPAVTYQKLLPMIPARYRLGLTATPDREDGLTRWVDWSFGPVLVERNTAEMIHLGYLMAAEIEEIETDFRFAPDDELSDRQRMAALEEAIATDLVRNIQIADRAIEEARAGESVLILTGRREWCAELVDMIAARSDGTVSARHVTGQTSKKKRKATIEELRAGTLSVLVATSLADEGLDIERLSRVILAAPAQAKGRTAQRLGRLLRLFTGKKPKLIDVVDPHVPTLVRRTQERRRVWKQAGLTKGKS